MPFSATTHPVSLRIGPATVAVVYTAAALVIALASMSLNAVLGWFTPARFPPVAHAGGWFGSQLNRSHPVPTSTETTYRGTSERRGTHGKRLGSRRRRVNSKRVATRA